MNLRHAWFSFPLCCATVIAVAQPQPLTGGGEVSLRREGDFLSVTVTGPRGGLASLCLAVGSQVRILHASAAVGEAVYHHDGGRWTLKRGFEWQLRDSWTGRATAQQREAFLSRTGWVANADRTGSSAREFRIRLTGETDYLAATFLATAEPLALSYWPPAMADDGCRLVEIARGYLPVRATFRPETWHRVPR